MSDKIDRTAEIFTALGVTPETHPWSYWVRTPDGCYRDLCDYMSDNMLSFDEILEYYGDDEFLELNLLSGTLEADGLAVRLLAILATEKYPIELERKRGNKEMGWQVRYQYNWKGFNPSFAAAVHDALCEALGITKEEKG